MGELLDALNAVDERAAPPDRPRKWALDQAAETRRQGDRGMPRARRAVVHPWSLGAAGASAGLGDRFRGRRTRNAPAVNHFVF
jgi:hypothetical protein